MHVTVHIHVTYFHGRSLCPKIDELHVLPCFIFIGLRVFIYMFIVSLTARNYIIIICITETWPGDDITASKCSIPGYYCVRCDTQRHGRGGGARFKSDTC